MTLNELAKMRRLRARPAMPIILTNDSRVHEMCARNDFPVIWEPGLDKDADLSPLNNLDVWMVTGGNCTELADKVRAHNPETLWIVGYNGFFDFIGTLIGRPLWTS